MSSQYIALHACIIIIIDLTDDPLPTHTQFPVHASYVIGSSTWYVRLLLEKKKKKKIIDY